MWGDRQLILWRADDGNSNAISMRRVLGPLARMIVRSAWQRRGILACEKRHQAVLLNSNVPWRCMPFEFRHLRGDVRSGEHVLR